VRSVKGSNMNLLKTYFSIEPLAAAVEEGDDAILEQGIK
jgi:hypothetical protein